VCRRGCWKGLRPFPGLVISIGIFSVYCAAEALWKHMTYAPKSGKKFKFTKEVSLNVVVVDLDPQGVGEVPELKT